ncbi:MAG TPA: hypothetical protein VK081_03480 [Planctomycetota bacterium]|nr:hypothetical protein [Planctomycetota bacterium]
MVDLAEMGRRRAAFLPIREGPRVALLGVLLAFLVYVTFFYNPAGPPSDVSPVIVEKTPVPELDPAILAQIRDETRNDRIPVEPEPLAHLLEKSMMVVPSVAKALGITDEPMPIGVLRANPAAHRGRYVWFKGQLEALDGGREGHPIKGYRIHEARIRTGDGEPVLFTFTVPPPEGLAVGDWVRVEGFFMKLRDAHYPVPLNQAPLLVGPEIFRAYPDWKAVEKLDPAVLARIKDGVRENGVDVDLQDADVRLPHAQDVPLWHFASYAQHRAATMTPEEIAALPHFENKDQWDAIARLQGERGKAWLLTGIFCRAHVIEAKTNPLGIENWSEVWLYSRGFAHRPFAVWIPKHVGEWIRNDTARCVGYFFKRYVVEGGDGKPHLSPLFVAADLERVEFNPLAASKKIGLAMGAFAALLVVVFFVLSRRDRRDRERYEQEMVRRRRRRRGAPVPSPT